MTFKVVNRHDSGGSPGDVLLVKDNWNDWFLWVTQYFAIVVLEDGSRFDIGSVKIARVGMSHQDAISNVPSEFPGLGDGWFSIGQSENYYETLNSLGEDYRKWFLDSLRDCAKNLGLLTRHENEEVLGRSLLRDISMDRVRNRFHRLANGDAALTPFAFRFLLPIPTSQTAQPTELTFQVTPESQPPSNVHVLIGRNGVGKTRCFDLLGRTFLGLSMRDGSAPGELTAIRQNPFGTDNHHGFAGLITVSFSPFDDYGPLVSPETSLSVRYSYVGLIQGLSPQAGEQDVVGPLDPDQRNVTIKGRRELGNDFVSSVAACRSGARRARWAKALRALEADPLFEEANVSSVAEEGNAAWEESAWRLFRRLSSGHSVVLLTISKLIALVEEKSLVLIDEPEGHLHPPLLSAFIRALSDLLIDRNGVAIIATHSPVVLQDVPRDCVWILNRSGASTTAERPESETFGENVGTLTREVFGLEVVQTGFHRMIARVAADRSYEGVLEHFGGHLGAEARGLARALTLIAPTQPMPDQDEE